MYMWLDHYLLTETINSEKMRFVKFLESRTYIELKYFLKHQLMFSFFASTKTIFIC